jgi:hypothetical protein
MIDSIYDTSIYLGKDMKNVTENDSYTCNSEKSH